MLSLFGRRHSRRAQTPRLANAVPTLESRQLPSAAPFPLPAAELPAPQDMVNSKNFHGNWKVNSDPTIFLILNQNSNDKVTGYLSQDGVTFVDIEGKVGNLFKFHGRGTYQGQSAKISFVETQATTLNGVLINFKGNLAIKIKGSPKTTLLLNADRIS